jgi:hypothetical protein
MPWPCSVNGSWGEGYEPGSANDPGSLAPGVRRCRKARNHGQLGVPCKPLCSRPASKHPGQDIAAVPVSQFQRTSREVLPPRDPGIEERAYDQCSPNAAGRRETPGERPGLAAVDQSSGSSPTSARRSSTRCGDSVRVRALCSAASSRSALRGNRSRWALSRRLSSSSAAMRATSSPLRRRMSTISRSSMAESRSFARFARAAVGAYGRAQRRQPERNHVRPQVPLQAWVRRERRAHRRADQREARPSAARR